MPLIQTFKQIPVALPEICAPRPSLRHAYDQAALSKYIYVQAPAGYGKTISTLLWLKKTAYKPIWISLDHYDNTPLLFYKLFCSSLLGVLPYDEHAIQTLKSPTFNTTPVECTMDLIAQLPYEDCSYILIFDDFHTIYNVDIRKSLPYVLKRLPIVFKVIFMSRNGLLDTELSMYGDENISFITPQTLSFSSEEIKKHFASYGHCLHKDAAQAIHNHTEGWVLAINAMATRGITDVSEETPVISITGFIEKTIWQPLDDPLRHFLMCTAIADQFTLGLCEALTEDTQCLETLQGLLNSNICLSQMGAYYRYHNLLLDFLRNQLAQSPLDQAALNKKAADYYLKIGDFLSAKKHAMKSGDLKVIAQTIHYFYNIKLFSLDEYAEFHQLYHLNTLPDLICNKMPLLYLSRIFFAYLNGDIDVMHSLIDKLIPLLPVIADCYPESLENAISILMLDCRIKLTELGRYQANVPLGQCPPIPLHSPTFTFQLPFLHRSVRDFYGLLDPWAMKCAQDFSKNILVDNLQIMFQGANAGLLMEQNKLSESQEAALCLEYSVNDLMHPEFVYPLYVLIAELYLLQNQSAKFEATIKKAKAYLTHRSSLHLLKNLSAYETRVALLNKDKSAAEHWLSCYYISDHTFDTFYKIYQNFTTVRAYIVLQRTDEAECALLKLKTLSEQYDRPLDSAEAEVLLAILEWTTGKKKEAHLRLQLILEKLYPFGFMRVIANEGRSVMPILSSIIKRGQKDATLSDEFILFTKKVLLIAYEQSKYFKGLAHPISGEKISLSPQQKYILELLSKGYRNAEIVSLTGLSLNTIRTHTKLAYKKLEVTNAMDAIVKAKQVGVIE